jgi:hypothetical protein
VRGGIEGLRRTVRGIGSLVQAPAEIAGSVLGTARSLGNVMTDLDDVISDTREEYLALGEAWQSTKQTFGPGMAKRTSVQLALAPMRRGLQEGFEAIVDIFEALDRRAGKRIAVSPGTNLALVAKRETGDADNWPDIAAENGIAGQIVPPGVTSIVIPRSVLLGA